MTEKDTKSILLDTAEDLFSRRGFDATSLREIIREAGVNTAAVHYHFGSRIGLIEAVIARRAEPINAERLRRLDEAEARHRGAPPIELVVRALIEPLVLARAAELDLGGSFGRLIGRVVLESDDELHDAIVRTFEPIERRFLPAFQKALPNLSIEELEWRAHMVVGSMLFAVTVPAGRTCRCRLLHKMNPKQIADRLVSFAVTAMTAPAIETGEAPR